MSSRKATYTKADDASSSREERMNRLKAELREHIRFLSDYELLSQDWLRMAESLHQIANVAFMETHLPPSEDNPLGQQGKKTSGTLWDQEKDELAVRILLEEGKLNLVLRILHKFKVATRSDKWEDLVKTTCAKYSTDTVSVVERCRVFEQSLGVLLRFALAHVEALQILDMPEFIQHATEVIIEAAKQEKAPAGADSEKMQETLIVHYLASIAAKMEELDEDRVMDLIEQHQLLKVFVNQLCSQYAWYKVETLEAASRFLNGVVASEAFQSEKNRFVPDRETEKKWVALKGYFVAELVSTYGLKKKEVQPLLDELAKMEKQVGAAVIVPLKRAKPTATTVVASSIATSSTTTASSASSK